MNIAIATAVPTLFFGATMALLLDGAGGPLLPVLCATALAASIAVTLLRFSRALQTEGVHQDVGEQRDRHLTA